MDDQAEPKTGVDAVQYSSKKHDKALLALKARRTVTEQQIDRVNDFLKRLQEDSSGVSSDELDIRLKALDSAFDAFNKVQAKIEEKDFDEISQPNRAKYEELYYYIAATLKVYLSRFNKSDSNQTIHASHAIEADEKYDTVKLPKIELREFSGDVTTWIAWFDEFTSLVHNNEKLNTFTKLHHLVSKLSPAAKAPIAGLKIIAENYEIILQRLRERFENKKIIGNQHIKQIFEHPKIIHANAADLRELIDAMNNHLIGLKNINRPIEGWDDLMVYIITSKLDPDTLNKWNEESAVDRLPTLCELLSFLKRRCQILEGNLSSVSLPGGASTSRAIEPKRVQRAAKSFVTVKNCCNFCQKPGHLIYRCSDFLSLSVADRLNKVHALKLCVNCLKLKKHNLSDCTSKGRCLTCGKGHHSLLHFGIPQVANYAASKHNQINESNHIEPAGNANHNMSDQAQPKNFAALKTQHTERNILATAIVYIISKYNQRFPCRVLLDGGSQINMISERMVHMTGLKRHYAPIQFQCANKTVGTSNFKCVTNIESLLKPFSVTVEAHIVDQISGTLPDAEIGISNWNIPEHIPLADERFNIPQRVDMLLGVDIFFDILENGKIALGRNRPILTNTRLGWIVAGTLPHHANSITYAKCNSLQISNVQQNDYLSEAIKAFWEVESFKECSPKLSQEEEQCELHFQNNFTRLPDGRFSVKLPFKSSTSLLAKGGFSLNKWCANNQELIKHIPEEKRENLFTIKNSNAIKTLGIVWDPAKDKFLYKFDIKFNENYTKRTILSEISQFFDPIGIISPVIIMAKIFIQQLWRLDLNWDDELPIKYQKAWSNFRRQLCNLNDLEVDRLAFTPDAKYEIHAFSDSSESAYGACIYIRCINDDIKITSNLLCAKSKVAPIKKCSLPRLELCAAVTMVQLVKKVQEVFECIQFNDIFFWTDSTIVLSWISEDSCNWSTFVANRVAIIQQVSTRTQWRHIPSNLNPADILSRGVLPAELMHSTFWFHGPNFLMLDSSIWPQFPYNLKYDHNILERKPIKMILTTTVSQQHDLISGIKFHNDYVRLLNTVAYLLRFLYNCKFKAKGKYGSLDAIELDASRLKIIKYVQVISFHAEIAALQKGTNFNAKSHLQSLSPFLDNNGILRVGGRLRNSNLDFNSKHPILLPKNRVFTYSLVRYYHKINHHVGPQTLLSIIRQSYWPIHGKVICKSICRSCVLCFRTNPTTQNHLMGDLPDLRVQQSRPFNIIGVDFCGPFQIYYGRRGIVSTKGYISVFICFCTKAIHLELVEDLSAQAFLAALRRFIGRRGLCSVIYSDNATNFIGVKNELHELYKMFKGADIVFNECASRGIIWKTIPPRSPHFGGLWEAAVKSTKFHLKRILQDAKLNFFEFNTLLIQIEAVLNSRPITPVPESPHDEPASTPGHFIIGSALNTIPVADLRDVNNVSHLRRYQRLQYYLQQFWDRWSKEYLQTLQNRTKWTKGRMSLAVGDVVVLEEDNLPPQKWRLGRITEIHPGIDGVVRVVTVKTSSGEIRRASTKVRRLPIERTESIQGGRDVQTKW